MTLTTFTMVSIAITIGLAALLCAGIFYSVAAPGPRVPAATVRGAAAVVLAWTVLAILLGAQNAYAVSPSDYIPWIALGVVVPIIAGARLHTSSAAFRGLVDAVPPQWLIGVQLYRVVGVLFLFAYAADLMPAEFAFAAGVGDILVGLTAPLAAVLLVRKPKSGRSWAIAWNVFGIADMVLALALGFLTSPSRFQVLALDAPNAAVSRFPFVLIPTFVVPVSILLHLFSLRRLRSVEAATAGGRSSRGGRSTAA